MDASYYMCIDDIAGEEKQSMQEKLRCMFGRPWKKAFLL